LPTAKSWKHICFYVKIWIFFKFFQFIVVIFKLTSKKLRAQYLKHEREEYKKEREEKDERTDVNEHLDRQ